MTARVVLVVEDDAAIRRGITDALRYAGYQVLECADGRRGLEMALASSVDLVLLDVLLPGMDGFAILDEIRRVKPGLPIIMVTARGAESDRVHGLKSGADDYVVKPFGARELLARVEAVLRRSAERPAESGRLRMGDRTVDLERREVRFADGTTRTLSEKETAILHYLAGSRERAVSREELLQRLWGLDPRGLETRTVDMHVARLREKLEDHDESARLIVTVRSKGYMLAQCVAFERT
ncbi:MAG: response regulator transcription factor [Planctomycetota bacterium]